MILLQGEWWSRRRFFWALLGALAVFFVVYFGPKAVESVKYLRRRARECAEIHFLIRHPRTVDDWMAFGHGVLEYIRLYGTENLRRRDVKRQLEFFGRTALMRYRQILLCNLHGDLELCKRLKMYDFRDLETSLH